MKPSDGISLDEIGMRPQAYGRGGKISEFEKDLWQDFLAVRQRSRQSPSQRYSRAANGEAVSIVESKRARATTSNFAPVAVSRVQAH